MTNTKAAPPAKTDINWRLHGSVTDMTQDERVQVICNTIEEYNGMPQMRKDIRSYRRYIHQNLVELKVLNAYYKSLNPLDNYRHPVVRAIREAIEKLTGENQKYRGWIRKRTFLFDHLLPRTGTRLKKEVK